VPSLNVSHTHTHISLLNPWIMFFRYTDVLTYYPAIYTVGAQIVMSIEP